MDDLAGDHTSILVFDCEFWRTGKNHDVFFPREIGGFQFTKSAAGWSYRGDFLVTLFPPNKTASFVSSAFATVTPATAKKLDELQNSDAAAESVAVYLKDPIVKDHHKPSSWLKRFFHLIGRSLVVVKGPTDLLALENAAKEFGHVYSPPAALYDVAKWNSASQKTCHTARLEGTYDCIKNKLSAPVRRIRDTLPIGKIHDPRTDASLALIVALHAVS